MCGLERLSLTLREIAAAPAFDHTATGDVRAAGIARVFAARVEV